ncbi:MAG TPA: hypothetical protein ENI34_07510 [candidate division WOR-3 bacterium]|uniref:LTD domain-containing protein n=1 Tax=candidate division WOR-3 bacterium TaxID=2052148 RepID=A0A9C9K0E4_UNCW3|nr:hypothetical protein [candidate division WOR-3 bacterium]
MLVSLLLFIYTVDSPLVISEVMSNVRGSESGAGSPGDRNEYIELYNQSSDTIDLALFHLSDFDAEDSICAWTDERLLIKYPGLRIYSTKLYPFSYCLILDREYTSDTTTGGYVQPYDFPDSLLVVTTANTTIGNGIQNSDPLIVFSNAAGCTTSFGTPYDSSDFFPSDPGDGISWERIDLSLPDEVSNWHPSLDSSGATPGRENSTTDAFDLAVDSKSIFFIPAELKSGEDVTISVRIKNFGLRATDEYELLIFDDLNRDSIRQIDELVSCISGEMVNAFDSVVLFYVYETPAQGIHPLGFEIAFSEDKNPGNNLAFKELTVTGEIGELALSPSIFTPDNDGCNDRLQIDYRLPQPGGYLTITVFDARGRRLHNIFKKEFCAEDRGTVYWDGSVGVKEFPSGMYIVYLEYRYKDRITKAKKTAVLAR